MRVDLLKLIISVFPLFIVPSTQSFLQLIPKTYPLFCAASDFHHNEKSIAGVSLTCNAPIPWYCIELSHQLSQIPIGKQDDTEINVDFHADKSQ
jgi:hypothetical protein